MNRDFATVRWRDVGWGVTALTVLAAGALTVFFADTVRRALAEGPRIVVTASRARGLVPGAEVWIAGARAGRVLSIRFGDATAGGSDRVIVDAVLHREVAYLLRGDATVRISSSALLAPPVLQLEPGTHGAGPFVFADTMTVIGTLEPERFQALADSLRGSIDRLAVESDRLAVELRSGRGTLGRLRADSALFDRVRDRAAIISGIAAETSGTSSLARLARDDSLSAALARTGKNLRRFAEAAPPTVAAIDSLAIDIERLTARLDQIRAGLDRGYGTLGRALRDGEIADQVDRLRAARDSAMAEVLRNPFRWLRVRLF